MSSTDISNILKQLDELAQPKQLPALFKPHDISPVLGSPEKKNPMSGYFVGGEGAEPDAKPVWYAIRHRETGRTLSSHKDEAAARDEMAGLGDQRQEYKLVKTSRRPNQFGLDEEDSGGQQYAVTIDAIDHGVLSPITVTASSPAAAKQKAIASATASMAKRGYELQVRSAGVKSAQGVAEGMNDWALKDKPKATSIPQTSGMNSYAMKGDVHNKAYEYPPTHYDKDGKDMYGQKKPELKSQTKGMAEAKVVGHVSDVAGHGKVVQCAKCDTDLRDDHGFALDNGTYICRSGKCSMRQAKNRLAAMAARGEKPRWRKDEDVTEGLDPDTQRLEQEVRDALANGDDYTAKSLVKMAQTAADRNYLRKIIRQEMYGTGPGQGGVAESDEPGYVKYEQMKDKISGVLIKLYKQGKDAETIKQMGGRVAKHLGYDPTDSIYQDAWLTSFNDASLDGSLDQDSDDDYTDYSMRQGERGNPGKFREQGVAEGSLNEFAPTSGGRDDILKTLAAQWLHGDIDSGDLTSDIQSQEQIERRLEKGIVCPDGVKRKLYIDYSDDYEGVTIYSDDDWSITYKQDDLTESKEGVAEGSSSPDEYKRRLASIQSLRYDNPQEYAKQYRALLQAMPEEHAAHANQAQKGSYSPGERGSGTGSIGRVAEEASPMIAPPSNRFDSKQEAFAHAKAHGGKVFKSTYTDPNTGNKNVSFVVKKDQDVEEGWKQKLGAAALAGSMAMGASAGGVSLPGSGGSFTPDAQQTLNQRVQATKDAEAKEHEESMARWGIGYLKGVVAAGPGSRALVPYEDAKKELARREAAYQKRAQGDQKTNEQGVAEGSGDVNSKERYHFLYPHVPLDMHTDHEYNNLSDRDLQAVKSHQRELADKLGKPGAKKQGDIASHIQINRARSQYDQEQAHRRKVLDAEKIKRQARDAKRQQGVAEVAPPGARAERMVKHIKQGYARDGKLTGKEKAIAYATTWQAHNRGQVEEASADLVGFHLDTERAYNAVMERFGDVVEQDQESGMMTVPRRYWLQLEQVAYDADGIGAIESGGEKIAVDEVEESYWQPQIDEAIAQEDVLDKEKRHLGDYLQSVADAVKHDAALSSKDTPTHSGDTIGSAVKTVTTDDGHDLKIHGNEDDGFRISIKGRPSRVKFKSLDEAGMACEMYRSHRRHKLESADYIEEQ